MLDRQVVKALAEVVLFLEMSADDIVDPDAAVGALEQMAHTLQLAPVEVQRELAMHLTSLAPEYIGQEDFISGLPDSLGLSS